MKRYEFAKKYRNWTTADWNKVFFSDESKINLCGSDGRQYYWKRKNDRMKNNFIVPTIKHGGGHIQ